jgi:hypothetical protein
MCPNNPNQKVFIHFNANNTLFVKLTEVGKQIFTKHYSNRMLESYHSANGWYRFQFHELANIYGNYLYNGNNNLPFEMDMKMEIEINKGE